MSGDRYRSERILSGLDQTYPETFDRLEQVLEENVFEIAKIENGNYYVAYMMNDALESYLVFQNTVIIGKYDKEQTQKTHATISKQERKPGYVLAVRQADGNTFTMWFDELVMENHAYQYHNIGHYWVEGDEFLRQLVYRLGIIQDKYLYFNERFCNQAEEALLPVNGFGPLLAYVYVPWNAEEEYPSTNQGIKAFLTIAEAAKDDLLCKYIRKYQKKQTTRMQKKITHMLKEYRHIGVLKELQSRIEQASIPYDVRSFGEKKDAFLAWCREYLQTHCQDEISEKKIRILEEQPFTMWEGPFRFRFHFVRYEREKMRRQDVIVQNRETLEMVIKNDEVTEQEKKVFEESVTKICSML